MSSKKARRKKRQEESKERSRKKRNPAMLFILGIGLAVALTLAGAYFLGDGGDAPFPGAVWSAEHGHWH